MIDRKSEIPLCYQIKEKLRSEIASIGYGEQIATEQQLAAKYGVSRGTIRNAVSELVNEGLLYKIHGRGTFKGGIAVSHSKYVIRSFTEQLLSVGLRPGIKSIYLTSEVPNKEISRLLRIGENTPVWKLSSIRLANDLPIAYSSAYIMKDVIPELSASDLEMSLMAMLKEKFQIVPERSESYCNASLADTLLASRLGVSVGAPILRIEYIAYLKDNKPALVNILEALGEKYILQIEQGR